jgi:hypothetical protein
MKKQRLDSRILKKPHKDDMKIKNIAMQLQRLK